MSTDGEDLTDDKTPIYVWIGLSAVAAISFWLQAIVTEERFVPALNVVATALKLPDDVAGATLMAAGASSPELFSSIVSLFITHSALGLGTIVGSEIFNQLCICAGAIFAAKSGKLELNAAILTREVFFYALSIGLLYYALHDVEPVEDDPSGEEHIFISFEESCVLFGAYIAYVLVCAYMDSVMMIITKLGTCFGGNDQMKITPGGRQYGTLSKQASPRVELGASIRPTDSMPYLLQVDLSKEPEGNFKGGKVVEYERTASGEQSLHHLDWRPPQDESSGSFLSNSVRSLAYSDRVDTRLMQFLVHSTRPSHEHSLYDIEENSVAGRLSCFVWQRSYFYNKARFAIHGWHLRWITATTEKVYSVPDRADAERHRLTYPKFTLLEVDEKRLIIKLHRSAHKKRNFLLKAPSKIILDRLIEKLEVLAEANSKKEEDEAEVPGYAAAEDLDQGPDERHVEEEMIHFPSNGSNFDIILFIILFPFRFLMHWTIPDVRTLDSSGDPKTTVSAALRAVVSCLLWLIVGSYAMVSSLEHLADLMNIPAAVVGVTVSAVGTSLPNYVASKVAAEAGFGNMAVSNAFGSNTFNIMVGLGLPWVLYTSFGTGFQPYSGLRNEGILESVIVLASVLLIFVVIVLLSKFTLYKWHGILFVALYFAYLVDAIGEVYF